MVHSGMSLIISNVRVSDCAVCPKLSVATTYREYVPFGKLIGTILVHPVFQDRTISVHDKIYIVYQLIVAQLSGVDHIQLNSLFELDIGFILIARLDGISVIITSSGFDGISLNLGIFLYCLDRIIEELLL